MSANNDVDEEERETSKSRVPSPFHCLSLFLTHIQEANIPRQFEVVSLFQRLVVKVGAHVMGDAHDKSSEILEVAVERVGLFEELKLDHVSIVA